MTDSKSTILGHKAFEVRPMRSSTFDAGLTLEALKDASRINEPVISIHSVIFFLSN